MDIKLVKIPNVTDLMSGLTDDQLVKLFENTLQEIKEITCDQRTLKRLAEFWAKGLASREELERRGKSHLIKAFTDRY